MADPQFYPLLGLLLMESRSPIPFGFVDSERPQPQRGTPTHMGNIVHQPTLKTAYFCNLGYVIVFSFDSKWLGEMAGEIKVI